MKQGPVVPVAMILGKLKHTWTYVILLKKVRALSSRNGHCATSNKDIGQITRSPDHNKGFNPNNTGGRRCAPPLYVFDHNVSCDYGRSKKETCKFKF